MATHKLFSSGSIYPLRLTQSQPTTRSTLTYQPMYQFRVMLRPHSRTSSLRLRTGWLSPLHTFHMSRQGIGTFRMCFPKSFSSLLVLLPGNTTCKPWCHWCSKFPMSVSEVSRRFRALPLCKHSAQTSLRSSLSRVSSHRSIHVIACCINELFNHCSQTFFSQAV